MQRLGLVFVALLLMAPKGCESKKEKQEATNEVASSTQAVDVSASQLFADYKANEVAADSKYRGKVLRVSGKISTIGKDVMDDPYVELATSNDFEGVHAGFDSEGALGSLKKGQKVTVRCRGNGSSIGSPMLEHCVLE